MKKKTTLPNDYERMIPEYHKGTQVYGEHIARYESIGKVAKGKVVLDIASGSGYGTALIAKQAKKVFGVDVLEGAIEYAKEHYGAPNIEYLHGDGVKIPLETASVDLVVSFETIEHIKDYVTFMKEVKRVLKPDGLLLLSTPNDVEFAEGNHFHLHEFEEKELLKLAKTYYKNVKPYYQTTWISNMISDGSMMTQEWQGSVELMQVAPVKNEQFLYFYFLCSDRNIAETIDNLVVLGEHWSERKKVEMESKQILTEQHIVNLEAKVTSLEDELTSIKQSRSYKLAQRMKKAKHLF